MATLNKSIGAEWNDLPLFAEDTLVSLSVKQVIAKVKKILATCGLGYDKPLANYSPDTQSWRMSEGIFPLVEQPSLPILPPSGMTRNGALFQQPAWVPITDETGSSSWPTPTHGKLAGGQGAFNRVQELYSEGTITNEERKAMQAGNGGKLNPTWVEWLMGFPPGWTDLED
jgi:hypothetical protein